MPAKRRKAYEKKPFESTGISTDTSANIYMSMLTSPAWRELTAKQQILYLYCKAQYYAEKRKPPTEDHPTGSEKFFTMNKSKWCGLYGLYAGSNQKAFYRDVEALIEKGFLACVRSGKTTRTKSVYAYSSKWRDYGSETFEIEPREMTPSMLVKRQNKKATANG